MVIAVLFALPAKAALVGNTNQATLLLSPQTGSYQAGISFSIDVMVNTNNQSVNAIAAYINYNISLFAVDAIDYTGSVFTIQWESSTTSPAGMIKIGRSVPAPGVTTANGKIATIRLRGLANTSPSSDNFNFDFTAGDANKSAVFLADTSGGTYILSGVYNAMYTIVGGTADTTAPTISSVLASSITSSGATISWTTNEASNSQVDYGTTVSYGSQTTLDSSMVISHSQSLSGLSPSTTYHYRVKSRDAAGNLATGSDNTFTTSAVADATPPVRFAGSPSTNLSSGTNQATLSLTTNESATCRYSATAGIAYSSMSNTFLTTGGTSHSASISGLTDQNTYTYYVKCQDSAGNANPDDYQITFSVASTTDTIPPVLSSITASSIISDSAVITWTTNEVSDSQIEYGTTASYGSQTSLAVSLATYHSVTLSGLFASTLYHYRVKSRDAASNLAISLDFTFTTNSFVSPTPTPAPTLADGSLVRAAGDTKVFLIQNNQKQWIPSLDVFVANGYSWGNVSVVDSSVLNQYQEGSPVTAVTIVIPSALANATLIRVNGYPKVYALVGTKLHWIPNPEIFNLYQYKWQNVEIISTAQYQQYKETKLIKGVDDSKIYYIHPNGLKHWVINENIFNSYSANKWDDIIEVLPAEVNNYVSVTLIRLQNDPKVFLLQGTTRSWIKTADIFNQRGYKWGDVVNINQTEFNAYQEGTAIE
ncbi:MAG: hypothetical protein A2Y98_03315 [Candidatus Portnoybacteria bacterium RBG_19FT_COMBO_36_7]|uniref:Fibronectin type-III domain-containing protein n=1 Tax=Candidatus Portnoybacteria bacterium RBG_19FT_COMBO_36_7 TaxID=1801992 RepID=A0A1G2F7N1_9BACT|nr:MAG: hypothetical protein A2Y98_03315 [Candidatus Portnoybacteria bacterium RBG_19FT_COMBO_36_7]